MGRARRPALCVRGKRTLFFGVDGPAHFAFGELVQFLGHPEYESLALDTVSAPEHVAAHQDPGAKQHQKPHHATSMNFQF
jgi:hypothetical protein